MDAEEFSWWLAYYEMQPFGDDREDLRAAVQTSTLANIHRKKGAKPIKPEDVFSNLKRHRREQTSEEMKAACMAWNSLLGGSFK